MSSDHRTVDHRNKLMELWGTITTPYLCDFGHIHHKKTQTLKIQVIPPGDPTTTFLTSCSRYARVIRSDWVLLPNHILPVSKYFCSSKKKRSGVVTGEDTPTKTRSGVLSGESRMTVFSSHYPSSVFFTLSLQGVHLTGSLMFNPPRQPIFTRFHE
jgi:hypothetical protein